MPIPVSQLDRPRKSLFEQALEFLTSAPDQAFTSWEIYAGLQGMDEPTAAMAFMVTDEDVRARMVKPVEQALKQLEKQGYAQSGVFQAQKYYSVRKKR